MATMKEIITRVDDGKPNAFTEQQKFRWLTELEGLLGLNVFLLDIEEVDHLKYAYPEGLETVPLVKFPHDRIYDAWLEAKIDLANGEYDHYQNSMEYYNAVYGDFVRWFSHWYKPANGHYLRKGNPPYYLTAYGLAIQQGFQGTLNEWLDSLVGPQGEQGPQGPKGDTAYEIAVQQGFQGTVAEWLEDLAIQNTAAAEGYMQAAAGSAAASAESAEAAKDAKTGAEAAQGEAATAAGLAQSWAVGGTGTREGEDTDNAKYWCGKAKNLTPADIGAAPVWPGAGAHNAIYRGKNLGTAVTAAQWAAIKAGTFEDLYIGDYWVIGGVTYRIAAFDYYYNTGDTACTTHHVTLVPDVNMYNHVMNDTDTTTGAYVGSKMYTEGLTQAKTMINSAFGEAHILNHRQYLTNAATDGYESGSSWYDSTVEIMTEQNVYGGKIFGNVQNGTALPSNYTIDKSQYPLFAFRPDLQSNHQWAWLRDVVSDSYFAIISFYGIAHFDLASAYSGVRPAFSIYQS